MYQQLSKINNTYAIGGLCLNAEKHGNGIIKTIREPVYFDKHFIIPKMNALIGKEGEFEYDDGMAEWVYKWKFYGSGTFTVQFIFSHDTKNTVNFIAFVPFGINEKGWHTYVQKTVKVKMFNELSIGYEFAQKFLTGDILKMKNMVKLQPVKPTKFMQKAMVV